MDQDKNSTANIRARQTERRYERPQLHVYGDIRQITQNMGAATRQDNPNRSGTHLGNGPGRGKQ